MKEVQFQCEDDSVYLEQLERNFLFSYLLLFERKASLNILSNNGGELDSQNLDLLIKYISRALKDLIDVHYSPPSEKRRTKRHMYYRSFSFEEKKYVVDYTTNPYDRLIYLIHSKIDFLINCSERNKNVVIKILFD
ncbi:MAG: hypothetical protein H6581_16570 [Bacteroidia bacterium]|nr:hypothetical protein [Bacteroidia bacterium]